MSVDGVYIKNMEMPPAGCILIVFPSGRVLKVSSDQTQNIYGEAEAVPVPQHGRCIDADALEDEAITYYAIPALANAMDSEAELVLRLREIDSAPTIIPASEESK